MDRNRTGRTSGDGLSNSNEGEGELLLASRRSGFDRIRSGILDDPAGPILITGEEGAGKTWLWRQVERSLPNHQRVVSVDLTSGLSPWEFLLLIGDGLGIRVPAGVGPARVELSAFLRDEEAEGRIWTLVIDEGHCASFELWEEIRVLANRLGRSGGFGAMVILAQTELIRNLASRELAPIASRLEEHLHLPPLDVEEARALIAVPSAGGAFRFSTSMIEEIHRDARGNPRAILRNVRRIVGRSAGHRQEERATAAKMLSSEQLQPIFEQIKPQPSPARSIGRDDAQPAFVLADPAGQETARPQSQPGIPLVPSKPPLRLEDGLIEVGWRGDSEDLPTTLESLEETPMMPPIQWGRTATAQATSTAGPSALAEADSAQEPEESNRLDEEPEDEPIDDRYAALQAWSEWARNREKTHSPYPVTGAIARGLDLEPRVESSETVGNLGRGLPQDPEETEEDGLDLPTGSGVTLRAETQHDHAPYSQLFTGVRPTRQS